MNEDYKQYEEYLKNVTDIPLQYCGECGCELDFNKDKFTGSIFSTDYIVCHSCCKIMTEMYPVIEQYWDGRSWEAFNPVNIESMSRMSGTDPLKLSKATRILRRAYEAREASKSR